MAKVLPSK